MTTFIHKIRLTHLVPVTLAILVNMIFQIIAGLLLLDSFIAALIAFTKLGDDTIEQDQFIKRYLPLTKAWSVIYLALACYIAYLTFWVIV